MNIWLLCAYGSVPGEGWRDSRYTTIGHELSAAGHSVTWWTANFSHHFKLLPFEQLGRPRRE